MEKLEKHIKEKLEERKILPSTTAWERVESSLGADVQKSSRNGYWYAIAACLIGLLVISVVFFNTQNNESATQIVNVESKKDSNSESNEQTDIVVTSNKNNNIQVTEESNRANPVISPIKEEVIQSNKGLAVVAPLSDREKVVEDSFVSTKAEDLIINKKVEEVLATVINLESMANQVTDAEIDSLLRSAQQDVLKERLFQQDGKVDAMALLNEVEIELDQSFRNKIFEKLKQGFFKARTAVADRNQ